MTIAYLANSFPERIESYVGEEITELRRQGADVIACGIRKPAQACAHAADDFTDVVYVFPLRIFASAKASWLFLKHGFLIREFLWRAVSGDDSPSRKLRALVHTWLGAYVAVQLHNRGVRHVHVHHGYFGAWVGMVAARILNAGFSMTLHGSDLLVRPHFLDIKLKHCEFCFTVSEFNRRFILDRYPFVRKAKVLVQRLGIDVAQWQPMAQQRGKEFCILTAGRLHAVKNQAFLVRACHALIASGVRCRCLIAGEGEERGRLEQLISQLGLREQVVLLGHVPREDLSSLYAAADAVVLTSHSEGLPVTLMEAMAMERIVVAPEITGMAELVVPGKTGFLYQPGSLEDFFAKLLVVMHGGRMLVSMRQAARDHVEQHFNSATNVACAAATLLEQINQRPAPGQVQLREETYENSVLQQI